MFSLYASLYLIIFAFECVIIVLLICYVGCKIFPHFCALMDVGTGIPRVKLPFQQAATVFSVEIFGG